jgi:hypothetical protein
MQATASAGTQGTGSSTSAATPSTPTHESALQGMRLPEPSPLPTKAGWDIAQLRLPQDYSADNGESVQVTIPVHKPTAQTYFRAHPAWNCQVAMLEHEDQLYPVLGDALRAELEADLKVRIIIPCITRDGDVFLWPLAPLQATGRGNEWVSSGHRVFLAARKEWVRMRSNMRVRSYDIIRPKATWDEPSWPELTFDQMIEQAFTDSVINSLDHPVIRALQGDK